MSENERGIIDNEDRGFFAEHYFRIAERMMNKRLFGGPWRIEINGCVYKFTVTGYAKKDFSVWREQQEELDRVR